MDRKLGGPQKSSDAMEKRKISCPYRKPNPTPPSPSLYRRLLTRNILTAILGSEPGPPVGTHQYEIISATCQHDGTLLTFLLRTREVRVPLSTLKPVTRVLAGGFRGFTKLFQTYSGLWMYIKIKRLSPSQFIIRYHTSNYVIFSWDIVPKVYDDGVLIQLLCFWTLSIVLFLFKTHNG
jgi:hypothetical protein